MAIERTLSIIKPDAVAKNLIGAIYARFEAAGLKVPDWQRVQTRGRRRPLRWDGGSTLCAFVTSISDIDDLIPIVTAYQLEWNKMHQFLGQSALGRQLAAQPDEARDTPTPQGVASELDLAELGRVLSLETGGIATLQAALGESFLTGVRAIARRPADLRVRLLAGTYSQYQRAAQRWWSGIEPSYVRSEHPRRPAVYFVSSNSHSLNNLLGGYARVHRDRLVRFVRERDPEQLSSTLAEAIAAADQARTDNLLYYLLRSFLHDGSGTSYRDEVRSFDAESGKFCL